MLFRPRHQLPRHVWSFVEAGPEARQPDRPDQPVGRLRRRWDDLRPRHHGRVAGAHQVWERSGHRREHGRRRGLRWLLDFQLPGKFQSLFWPHLFPGTSWAWRGLFHERRPPTSLPSQFLAPYTAHFLAWLELLIQ